MRVAIYARYSSDTRQHDRSIADQIAVCRDYALQQGWVVVDTYADHGISGASIHGRHEFARLVEDAEANAFEVVLAEDLDRLSRDQADIADLHRRLTYLGIEIWTIADGAINRLHVGLKGIMNAAFLDALAAKTRRGQQGRVREGKLAGGRCYGYRPTARGERELVPEEAAIVERVYREYVQGDTPRAIVARLNKEGIPGPRGGYWNASTLHGMKDRGNGLLHNELYAGRLVWNRQRFVKNPATGKREARPNPRAAWVVKEVPHLRIVPQELWDAAQTERERRGAPHKPHTRRARHLLSGLLRCGVCGSGFVVRQMKRGIPGFKCSSRYERGLCDNNRVISNRVLEKVVFQGLQEHLLDEHLLSGVVRSYSEERQRLAAQAEQETPRLARRLTELDGEIRRAVDALLRIENSPALADRLRQLENEQRELKAKLERVRPAELPSFDLRIIERYRAFVADIGSELSKRERVGEKPEVVTKIRALIDRVEIYPRDDEAGRDLVLYGKIEALLPVGKQGFNHRMGIPTVVAGTRFERRNSFPTIAIPLPSRRKTAI